jgi:hypothetical protein
MQGGQAHLGADVALIDIGAGGTWLELQADSTGTTWRVREGYRSCGPAS